MILSFVYECKDKYTGTKYHPGDRVDFPEKRAKEILSTGYAIEIKAEQTEEVEENTNEVKTTKKTTRGKKKANNWNFT